MRTAAKAAGITLFADAATLDKLKKSQVAAAVIYVVFGGMTDQRKVPVFEYDPTGKYDKKNQKKRNEPKSKQ